MLLDRVGQRPAVADVQHDQSRVRRGEGRRAHRVRRLALERRAAAVGALQQDVAPPAALRQPALDLGPGLQERGAGLDARAAAGDALEGVRLLAERLRQALA